MQAIRYVTRSSAKSTCLPDIEEFQLCLSAFLPKWPFDLFDMKQFYIETRTVMNSLSLMSFTHSDDRPLRGFSSFSQKEKLKVKQILDISLFCMTY